MSSRKWPWTPTKGELAGQTFQSNEEYRAALDAARRRERDVAQTVDQLTRLVEAAKRCESAQQKAAAQCESAQRMAAAAQQKLADLMTCLAESFCQRF